MEPKCEPTRYALKLRESEKLLKSNLITSMLYGSDWTPAYVRKNLDRGIVILLKDGKIYFDAMNLQQIFQYDSMHAVLSYLKHLMNVNSYLRNSNMFFFMSVRGKVTPMQWNVLKQPYLTLDHRPQYNIWHSLDHTLHFALSSRSFLILGNIDRFKSVLEMYQLNKVKEFDRRIDTAIFRGAIHSYPNIKFDDMMRTQLIRLSLSKEYHRYIDARYTQGSIKNEKKYQDERNDLKFKSLFSNVRLSESQQMDYKYILILDGTSKPDRFARQLIYGSLNIKEYTQTIDWFYFDLIPFIHYTPFQNVEDLKILFQKLIIDQQQQQQPSDQNVDFHVKSMIYAGMSYIFKNFTMDYFDCHALHILQIYNEFYPQMCSKNAIKSAFNLKFGQKEWKNITKIDHFPLIHALSQDAFESYMIQVFGLKEIVDQFEQLQTRITSDKEYMFEMIIKRIHLLYGLHSESGRRFINIIKNDFNFDFDDIGFSSSFSSSSSSSSSSSDSSDSFFLGSSNSSIDSSSILTVGILSSLLTLLVAIVLCLFSRKCKKIKIFQKLKK